MKNRKMKLMLVGILLGSAIIPVFAQETSKEESKLEAGAAELNKLYSEGQQRVADKIKAQFGVSDALLLGMLYKNMRYGEIAITLGLAQGLHGGIRDKNLYRITTLRHGPPVVGWSKVAKNLGLKLGPVLSKIRKISADVRKQEKTDKEAEKAEREKVQKSAKMEGPVKTERESMKSLMHK